MKINSRKQTKQLNLLLLTLALLVLMLAAALPAAAGQEKSSVCHMTGTYDFGQGEVPVGHVITIADPALDSHMAHGDTQEYVEKMLPDGQTVCTVDGDADGDGVPDSLDLCYTNGTLSFHLDGPLGEPENMGDSYFLGTACDGPAGVGAAGKLTTLVAADQTEAEVACTAFFEENNEIKKLQSFSDEGYNTPDNWWYCRFDLK